MICIVFIIELFQIILLTGSFDVDDIILNVFGACVLYLMLHAKFINKIVNKITITTY